ncbi:haloacid dehalogenase type II [Mycolicibacterium cosmeticum]|uniref:2-haloalkanoic acid dehalogenase, type II n=1 Tax=Mycolicibacterium cosmeticum TaxID=258533 RepID=W9AVP7_MYCCO|nr:haloacid dehalogenase type II [Mycolicibacterium cosmeticum]TLH69285.1 haloacid dehalogenase type II [Mycolicibacterium cosmeticum]CDO06656.1 2-haloalkanoic acid dehalogenase, type II [Mycolicibacterium cosmeticum]
MSTTGRPNAPRILVFDVNETLLDIDSLQPHFAEIFGDAATLRTWFAELVLYSMTLTLSGYYLDFFALGRATMKMLATTRGLTLEDDDMRALEEGMRAMPAHPDVEPGLHRLRDHGYRLVTLTNSPLRADIPTPLDNAGLGTYFERQFTVDALKVFKPAPQLYKRVAADTGVAPADCMMVAAHAWDLIGAHSVGMRTALITRSGNAALVGYGIPHPDTAAGTILELADQLVAAAG